MDSVGQFDHMENEAIPRYDKRGRLFSDEERAKIAHHRGQCVRCGVHTHTGKAFRRKALTNDNVHNGICIRCQPEQCPTSVIEAWDLRNKPTAVVVSMDRHSRSHRGSRGERERDSSNTMSGMSTSTTSSGSGGASASLRRSSGDHTTPTGSTTLTTSTRSAPGRNSSRGEALTTQHKYNSAPNRLRGSGSNSSNPIAAAAAAAASSSNISGGTGSSSQSPRGTRNVRAMAASTTAAVMGGLQQTTAATATNNTFRGTAKAVAATTRLRPRNEPQPPDSPGGSSSRSVENNSGHEPTKRSPRPNILQKSSAHRSRLISCAPDLLEEDEDYPECSLQNDMLGLSKSSGGFGEVSQKSSSNVHMNHHSLSRTTSGGGGGGISIRGDNFMGEEDLMDMDVWELMRLLNEHATQQDAKQVRKVLHCLRNTLAHDQVSIVFTIKDIMEQYIHDPRIMDLTCGVLWRVCCDNDDKKEEVVTAGALDVMVDALRKNRNDYELATWCMGCWTSIAYSPENKAVAAQKGVMETILEVALSSPLHDWASVMEWACRCLYSFVHSYEDDDEHSSHHDDSIDCHAVILKNVASIEEADGVALVVKAMSANATEPIAQVWALKLLWRLLLPHSMDGHSDGDAATNRVLKKLVAAGYVPLAAKLLRLQSTTPELLQLAAELLSLVLLNHSATAIADFANTSSSSISQHSIDENNNAVAEAAKDCIAPLVRKMRETKQVPVQEVGCRLLSTLCVCTESTSSGSDAIQAALLESATPASAIVDAMGVLLEAGNVDITKKKAHDVDEGGNNDDDEEDEKQPENSNIGMLEAASWALWKLSSAPSKAMDATVVKRAISVMSKTYESSPSSTEVLRALCGFVANVVCRVPNLEASDFDVTVLVCGLGVDNATVARTATRSISLLIAQHAAAAKSLLDCLELSEIVSTLNDDASSTRDYWLPILLSMAVQSAEARASFQASGILLAVAALLKTVTDKAQLGAVLELLQALVVDQDPHQHALFPHDIIATLIFMLGTCSSSSSSSSSLALGTIPGSAFRENVCRTLTCVFLTAPATPSAISRTTAIALMDIINSTASTDVVSDDLRIEACKSLWALVVKQPTSDPLHPSLLRTMLECLVGLMTRYGEPFVVPVQEAAAGALAGVAACIRQTPVPVEVAEMDLMIADVYKAMALHIDGARVVGHILSAILNLCYVHEASLIQCGVIVVVVDSMVAYDSDADIQEKGCKVLAQLASSENVQVNLSIVETDGIQILVGALAVFADEPCIQAEACRAFSHLSTDDESRMLIVAQGGMRLIIEAVKRHQNHIGLLDNAFTALLNLTSDVDEAELSGSGIIDGVVQTMHTFPNSTSLRENGLGILQNVSMKGAPAKEAIAEAGGIETVINAIEEFMATPTVLERAFSTLWSLAVLPANQRRIAQANGLNLVISAMFSSMEYERVQQQGCGCLCTLATHPDNRSAIREADGASVIVFGMRAHFSSPAYQTAACRALSSISVPDHGEQIAISQDEANAVVYAMRRFQGVEELQFTACCALLNFVLNPDLTAISICLPEIRHAAETALNTFPEQCAEIAEQVVERLS